MGVDGGGDRKEGPMNIFQREGLWVTGRDENMEVTSTREICGKGCEKGRR